jgi:NAD(P) transhydrogenase
MAATFRYRAVVGVINKPGGTVNTTGGAPTKNLREAATSLTGFRGRDIYSVAAAAEPDIVLPTNTERTRCVCA